MSDKLRVFLSSTFADLREYREAAVMTLLKFGFIPIAFESFGVFSESPVEASMSALANSDILVLLLAHRYGYIPPGGQTSIIETEYDEARKLNKPILAFLVDDAHPWPANQFEIKDVQKLKAFKKRVQSNLLVSFFSSPEDLSRKLALAISQYSSRAGGMTPELVEDEKLAEIGLADIMNELKEVRLELTALQQALLDQQRSLSERSLSQNSEAVPQAADFLGVASSSVNHKRCFVIMPYSQSWSVAVERTILEVCQRTGFEFLIAKNMNGRFIPNDIWRGITGSEVIVADLSGANANVTYEIGLADVLGKKVILICQKGEALFDFLGQRLIQYENSVAGALTLREELTSRLETHKTELQQPNQTPSRETNR